MKVKKDKAGIIISYFLEESGWISKSQGIKMAREGRIDAVIAKSKYNKFYLRTKPDLDLDNNLSKMKTS